MEKLFIGDDWILYHTANKIKQIVLPSRYHRLVYCQLHEDMGHLGCLGVFEFVMF